jgi:nucleoside-diphosphate-sugar epimerase
MVTGAAGFIGSVLTIRLLDHGDTVIDISNHKYHFRPKLKKVAVLDWPLFELINRVE